VTYTHDTQLGVLTRVTQGPTTTDITPATVRGLSTLPVARGPDATAIVKDALNNQTVYTLDVMGRALRVQTPDGAVQSWTRNLAGQVVSYTDAAQNTTLYG
jgi:YD repeat-containing protein